MADIDVDTETVFRGSLVRTVRDFLICVSLAAGFGLAIWLQPDVRFLDLSVGVAVLACSTLVSLKLLRDILDRSTRLVRLDKHGLSDTRFSSVIIPWSSVRFVRPYHTPTLPLRVAVALTVDVLIFQQLMSSDAKWARYGNDTVLISAYGLNADFDAIILAIRTYAKAYGGNV